MAANRQVTTYIWFVEQNLVSAAVLVWWRLLFYNSRGLSFKYDGRVFEKGQHMRVKYEQKWRVDCSDLGF